MSVLKLPKLPDKKPVKLAFSLPPDLYCNLLEYADVYVQIYDNKITIEDLISSIIDNFLEDDRGFKKKKIKNKLNLITI